MLLLFWFFLLLFLCVVVVGFFVVVVFSQSWDVVIGNEGRTKSRGEGRRTRERKEMIDFIGTRILRRWGGVRKGEIT